MLKADLSTGSSLIEISGCSEIANFSASLEGVIDMARLLRSFTLGCELLRYYNHTLAHLRSLSEKKDNASDRLEGSNNSNCSILAYESFASLTMVSLPH